jgi:hypothetical protein
MGEQGFNSPSLHFFDKGVTLQRRRLTASSSRLRPSSSIREGSGTPDTTRERLPLLVKALRSQAKPEPTMSGRINPAGVSPSP